MTLRVLFMGTPDFAVPTLDAIVGAGHEVVGVVTQPDRPSGRKRRLTPPPIAEYAVTHGLSVYQPRTLRTPEAVEWLTARRPDVCVVVAFGQILRKNVLDLPPLGCFNVHASLLPSWRGAAPITWCLVEGDTQTGVTIMRMDEGLDTGPMITQETIEIDPTETAGTLHERLAPLGARLMAEVLGQLAQSRPIALTPQDDGASTYARMLRKADGQVCFDVPPDVFCNHVRGMTPWPGARCETADGILRFLDVRPRSGGSSEDAPGTVVVAHPGDGLKIAVRGGQIEVIKCQRPGKQAVAASAYLNGVRRELVGEVWRGRPDQVKP